MLKGQSFGCSSEDCRRLGLERLELENMQVRKMVEMEAIMMETVRKVEGRRIGSENLVSGFPRGSSNPKRYFEVFQKTTLI